MLQSVKKKYIYNKIKSNKILGVNLTKEVPNEYLKTPKYVKINRCINKWEYIPISWIRRLNIVKVANSQNHLEIQSNTYNTS